MLAHIRLSGLLKAQSGQVYWDSDQLAGTSRSLAHQAHRAQVGSRGQSTCTCFCSMSETLNPFCPQGVKPCALQAAS